MAVERVIRVKLIVDAPSSNDQATQRTAKGLDDVAGKADKGGSSLISFGAILGTALVAGAAVATKSMLTLGMAYESSLNTLQAVSGASAETMTQVSDAAKALGNDLTLPGASAADAAAAMTELAKGGLTVEQAMSAAKGTLQLAAAAQIDGAQAANIQSAALNTFGLAADQAGRVADVLANAANASSGEITDFAQGMAMSGLAAQAMGISLEDTASVLGIFANKGLSGSDAGTSFKTMLVSLTSPSKQAAIALEELGVTAFDAQGNFVGMRTITEQLTAAQQRMTTEQFNAAASTAFGTDAMRAAIAMAQTGPAGFDSMSAAIGRSGGAAELAAANSKGLRGAVDLVKNSAETAALTLYDSLSPALDTATRGIANMIPGLASELTPALSTVGLAFVDIVQAILPLVPILVTALAPALASLAEAIAGLAVNIGPLITKLGTLIGTTLAGAVPIISMLVNALSAMLGWVADLPLPILAGVAAFTAFSIIAATTSITLVSLKARAIAAGAAMKAAFINPAGLAILGIVTAVTALGGAFTDTEVSANDFAGAIDDVTLSVDALKIKDVVPLDVITRMHDAGVAATDYTAALAGNPDAQKRVTEALFANLAAQEGNIEGMSNASILLSQYSSDLGGVATAQDNAAAKAAEGADGFFKFAGSAKEADQKVLPLLSTLDAVGAAAGDTGAAAAASGPSLDDMTASVKAVAEASGAADTRLQFLQITLDTLAGRAPDVEAASRAAQAAIRGYVEAYQGQADAARGVEAANDKVTEAQIKLTDAQNKDTDSKYSAEQKALDVAAAARDLAAAQEGVTTATNDVSDASDSLFQSGQDVYRGFLQQTQAAFDAAVANGDLAGAQDIARRRGQELRDAFIAANTTLYGSAEAAGAVADSLGLIPAVTSATIASNADDVLGRIKILRSEMRLLDGTTATIYTNTVNRQTSFFVKGAEQAEGGIFQGGVQSFADGGITKAATGLYRQAMMARGGSGILWAEAGDESYIPHKRNARTEQIMSTTAGILGGKYTPAARMPIGAQLDAGGSGDPELRREIRQLSDAIARAGLGSVRKLADHLEIVNNGSDGTAGLNDALFRMPR